MSIYQIQREQPYNFSTYLPRYATILVHSFLASFGENKKQKKQLLESLPLRVNKNYNIHICYSLQEHSRTNHEAREKVGLKYQMASQIHIPDSSTNHSCSCKMRVIDHTRIARSITKVYSPNHWENTYKDHIYHKPKWSTCSRQPPASISKNKQSISGSIKSTINITFQLQYLFIQITPLTLSPTLTNVHTYSCQGVTNMRNFL